MQEINMIDISKYADKGVITFGYWNNGENHKAVEFTEQPNESFRVAQLAVDKALIDFLDEEENKLGDGNSKIQKVEYKAEIVSGKGILENAYLIKITVHKYNHKVKQYIKSTIPNMLSHIEVPGKDVKFPMLPEALSDALLQLRQEAHEYVFNNKRAMADMFGKSGKVDVSQLTGAE